MFGYASTICEAVPRLDTDEVPVAEDILLGLVDQGCTVKQVATAGDQITDLIAQRQGTEREPADSKRGFKRSWLSRSKSLDGGSWVKGWFNAEHTAAFDQIIGPLAKPKATWDDRDLTQRTADALFCVISEGNKGAGLTLIIDLTAYTQATGDTGPFDHTPRTPTIAVQDNLDGTEDDTAAADTSPTEDDGAPGESEGGSKGSTAIKADAEELLPAPAAPGLGRVPARLLDGTPISPADARRIALNAGISALLLGRDHLPLYLGRTVRFATPAQRKALLALYETCCVHGCQIPAHLCEIHHLGGGWKLGTATDLHTLAPACGWHNRWLEDHTHQITQTRDTQGRAVLQILPPWNTHRSPGTDRRETTTGGLQPGAP